MGTIDEELNDYVWEHLVLLEAVFSEKIYKILLRFKEKEDVEGFIDTLGLVLENDKELLLKIEDNFLDIENMSIEEVAKALKIQDYRHFRERERYIDKAHYYVNTYKGKDEKYLLLIFNLSQFYISTKNYKEAEILCKKSMRISEEIFGTEDIRTLSTYGNLAELYRSIEKDEKAEEFYLKSLGKENIDKDKEVLKFSYYNLGLFYIDKQSTKSYSFLEKALKLFDINDNRIMTVHNSINTVVSSSNKLFFLNNRNSSLNFKIEKLKIKNFKQYKSFFINFSKQINIIIGQNSIGKTTLLQAITLGLLKEDSLDVKQVEYDTCISKGEEKSELIIFHNDEEKKVEILKDKRAIEKNYFIPFVLAYGSNFFTSKTNEVKEVAQGIVNETIHRDFTSSIFVDYTSGFVNPIRLLEFLDLEKDEKVPEIQETFIKIINSFLEGFQLVATDQNYYFQKDNQDAPLRLEDLSEGYRGNVLLITDMLIKILGVGYTPKTIEGIVLIDEFDKHLHPRW